MKKDNMVNKYKVVDNFLPLKVFKEIQDIVTFKLPYYYKLGTATPNSNDLYHFVHYFYQDNSVCSNFFKEVIIPIMSNFTYYSLIRAKANCYPSTETQFTHALHTDLPVPHQGLIFHINNNNGYTILEDGTKIESIANRAVFLDTSKPHQSTTCTDQDIRLNININYV